MSSLDCAGSHLKAVDASTFQLSVILHFAHVSKWDPRAMKLILDSAAEKLLRISETVGFLVQEDVKNCLSLSNE